MIYQIQFLKINNKGKLSFKINQKTFRISSADVFIDDCTLNVDDLQAVRFQEAKIRQK